MIFDPSVPLHWSDIVGPAGVALTLAAGVWQYRRTSKREFIRPFREAQLNVYREATSIAARLATLKRTSKDWEPCRDEFLRLYYGPMAMLEEFDLAQEQLNVKIEGSADATATPDKAADKMIADEDKLTVEKAMFVFKTRLEQGADDQKLKALSLALAHTCRKALGTYWGVELRQFEGKYQKHALAEWKQIKLTR